MWPALLMAGMGAYQYNDQKKKAKEDRKLAAATQALSPWTGLQAQEIQRPDAVGTIGQGAVQGMAMEQNMDKAAQQNQLNQAQMEYYKGNTPAAGGNVAPPSVGNGGVGGGMSMADPEQLKMLQMQNGGMNSYAALMQDPNYRRYNGG
jgi:GH24 family phage-related lysozyme (muramidase)